MKKSIAAETLFLHPDSITQLSYNPKAFEESRGCDYIGRLTNPYDNNGDDESQHMFLQLRNGWVEANFNPLYLKFVWERCLWKNYVNFASKYRNNFTEEGEEEKYEPIDFRKDGKDGQFM